MVSISISSSWLFGVFSGHFGSRGHNVLENTIDSFGLTISLWVIGGCFDVMDLVDMSQSLDEFIDKFRSSVAGDFLWNSMLTDDFFINKCED